MNGNGMQPRQWERGTVLVHRTGGVAIVSERKADDSGWWCFNGGGLDDRAATSGSWMLLTAAMGAAAFAIAYEGQVQANEPVPA